MKYTVLKHFRMASLVKRYHAMNDEPIIKVMSTNHYFEGKTGTAQTDGRQKMIVPTFLDRQTSVYWEKWGAGGGLEKSTLWQPWAVSGLPHWKFRLQCQQSCALRKHEQELSLPLNLSLGLWLQGMEWDTKSSIAFKVNAAENERSKRRGSRLSIR